MLLANLQVCFALIYIVSLASSAENHQTNLKNLTETENKNKPTIKNEENPLKNQIKKYLKECGADIPDEDESSTELKPNPRQQNNPRQPNRGTYPTSYGSYEQDSRRRVYRDSVDIFNSSNSNLDRYRDRNYNKRRGNKNKNYYDDYEDDDEDTCMEPNRNKNRFNNNRNSNRNKESNRNNGYDNRGNGNNGYDNKGSRYGNRNGNRNDNNRNRNEHNRNENNRNENNRNENNRFDPYGNRNEGNEDFGAYGWGGNRGYSFYGGRMMARPDWTESFDEKRLVKRYTGDDDVQLDDNRVPSETELIKFIQNNIQNSTKRMQAIREARRCFARLVTSDNEDGCVFSKMLGKCLKLDIQDNS